MRCLLTTVCVLLFAAPILADEPLPSTPLMFFPVVVAAADPTSFDLIDFRAEQRLETRSRLDVHPHSMFVIKQHVGIGAGYDNGVVHGSLGFYITVAEWGRWNYGIPSPALGFGRYPVYDAKRKQSFIKNESSLFISLASVHYRIGYLRSLGVNWYVNFEQIFDSRQNMAGSQVGFSFSTK
jgi:hypothetical protein